MQGVGTKPPVYFAAGMEKHVAALSEKGKAYGT